MRVSESTGKAAGSAASKSEASQDAEAVEKFAIEELRAGARRLFGVSKHVVAGALALERKTEWTLEEAERKVKAFLAKEVPMSDHAKAQGRTV